MSDLIAYWRNEARHIDVAIAVGDELTAEYAGKATDTANTLQSQASRITRLEDTLRRIVGHYGSNAEGETEAMRALAREALAND